VAFQLRKSGWKSARFFYVTKRR